MAVASPGASAGLASWAAASGAKNVAAAQRVAKVERFRTAAAWTWRWRGEVEDDHGYSTYVNMGHGMHRDYMDQYLRM